MVASLKAENRTGATKSETKQLRTAGQIPGVVYGKKIGIRTIAVEAKQLLQLLKNNPNAVVDMEIPETGTYPVMVHEVQRDTLRGDLLHIDFHQINLDEPVRSAVSLEFIGEAKGAAEGGLFQVQLHELDIRCLPNQIPSTIHVDVSLLELGHSLLVKDLHVPGGIEVKSDPNDVVVTILAPQKEDTEPVAAVEPAKPALEVRTGS